MRLGSSIAAQKKVKRQDEHDLQDKMNIIRIGKQETWLSLIGCIAKSKFVSEQM
jgi:hypothetical protein